MIIHAHGVRFVGKIEIESQPREAIRTRALGAREHIGRDPHRRLTNCTTAWPRQKSTMTPLRIAGDEGAASAETLSLRERSR